jgi:hypothetical protein
VLRTKWNRTRSECPVIEGFGTACAAGRDPDSPISCATSVGVRLSLPAAPRHRCPRQILGSRDRVRRRTSRRGVLPRRRGGRWRSVRTGRSGPSLRWSRGCCPLCSPFPSSWRLVDGTHQLFVDLVEVDPDDAVGLTLTVTRQLTVGDQSAHCPVTDLQALGSFRDSDVVASHHVVHDLDWPSCSSDSRSMRWSCRESNQAHKTA